MIDTSRIQPPGEIRQKMSKVLGGYWSNDVWDIRDDFFENFRPPKRAHVSKTLDFSAFSPSIREEVKYIRFVLIGDRKREL